MASTTSGGAALRPASSLDSLPEESLAASTNGNGNGNGSTALDDESLAPIPTLASLLLSTASSLALKSRAPQLQLPVAPFANPANPAALLSDPSSTEYLASLLGLPLPSLQALPASLATLSSSLDTDLSSLAFTRYSAFLLSHAATQRIAASFTTLSDELAALLDSTAALDKAAGAFESRVHDVRRKRERMARVRERMDEVEELLEASAVVDACVRAGYWSEAIDVATRLAELHARLSVSRTDADSDSGKGALVLLDRVRDEVSLALLALRARVLESLLQRGLKLPAAVRGVGILRRMNAGGIGLDAVPGHDAHAGLGDEALRIVFLAARWRCLRAELDSVEGQMAAAGIMLGLPAATATANGHGAHTDGPVGAEENDERTRWAKRWIELWREVVGETVGMYTEVFLASPPVPKEAAESLDPTAPLSLFLASALAALTSTFTATLPALTATSSLSSLLTQLSYCSHSFARYGLEFREVERLREQVEQRVGAIVVAELEAAGVRWEKEWRDGWEGGVRRRGRDRQPLASWLVVPEGLQTALATPLPPAPDSTAATATWHHQPAPSLSLLPPLARFLNAHATALNALRLLPAISLFPVLRQAQGRALERATKVLAAFVDAWHANALAHAVPPEQLDQLSHDERAAEQVRQDEQQLIGFSIAAFGRWVVPWCEGALRVGVYAELRGVEDLKGTALAQDAMRKAEALVARVEGRDEEPVDAPAAAAPAVEEPPPPAQEPPPPSLEPELDLPPSLDPSVDVPPPADNDNAEITFERSLEPTLERTEELVPEREPEPELAPNASPAVPTRADLPLEGAEPVSEAATAAFQVEEETVDGAPVPDLDPLPVELPSSPPLAAPTVASESVGTHENGTSTPQTNTNGAAATDEPEPVGAIGKAFTGEDELDDDENEDAAA